MPLSIEALYEMDDEDVRNGIAPAFVLQLQNSAAIRALFFPDAGGCSPCVSQPFVDQVATALVCDAISRSSTYGFGQAVDGARAREVWNTALADASREAIAEGQNLYALRFPAFCRGHDGHDGEGEEADEAGEANASFADYLEDDPVQWSRQLAEWVQQDSFINVRMNALIAGDANWSRKLNLIFYKLARLGADAATIGAVLERWREAQPDTPISIDWSGYSFLPALTFADVPSLFLDRVNATVESSWTSDMVFVVDMYFDEVGRWWGTKVVDWLADTSGLPRQMGLAASDIDAWRSDKSKPNYRKE